MITYQNCVIRKRTLNVKERDRIYEYFDSLGLSFSECDVFIQSLNSLIREAHRPLSFYLTTGVVSKVTTYLDGVSVDCNSLNGCTPLDVFEKFCAYIYRLMIIH